MKKGQRKTESLASLSEGVIQLANADKANDDIVGSQCTPNRLKLPIIKDFFDELIGIDKEELKSILTQKDTCNGFMLTNVLQQGSNLSSSFPKRLEAAAVSVHSANIAYAFEYNNGRIFTLHEELVKRLLDIGEPSREIDTSALSLPISHCYLEFGNADSRKNSLVTLSTAFAPNAIVDGVYLREVPLNKERVSSELKEHFALNAKGVEAHILELAMTISPLSIRAENLAGGSAYRDITATFNQLVIIKDMPLMECIELNQEWLSRNKLDSSAVVFTKEIISLIYNTLLYINLDTRVERKVTQTAEGKTRMSSASNPNKKRKATIACANDYSRIEIGSNKTYTRLEDVLSMKGVSSGGTKSPHVRRGHFAPRWSTDKDTGAKVLKISRIKTSIINKHLLDDDDITLLEQSYSVI
ncbi:hypothetical protein VCHA53O466_50204 [Vibrio chagasii]|nr:hypothetical protein VCHA53O466_50204 [Vibrio chagasii]